MTDTPPAPDTMTAAPTLGRPPETPLFLRWFALLMLRLLGWRVVGEPPPVAKAVVVAAPHTSNWDGVLMVLASWSLRTRMRWMVKAEWTRHPLIGWLVRATGAMGIDRSGSFDTVQQAVQEIERSERIAVVVPPEGTRRRTDHWKTGFYWIAVGAGVPVLLAKIDFGQKTMDISAPLFHPTGDIDADMAHIWAAYANVTARHPEKVSEPRLRPASKRNPMGRGPQDGDPQPDENGVE